MLRLGPLEQLLDCVRERGHRLARVRVARERNAHVAEARAVHAREPLHALELALLAAQLGVVLEERDGLARQRVLRVERARVERLLELLLDVGGGLLQPDDAVEVALHAPR